MDGSSEFPSRPEMEASIAEFVRRARLPIRWGCTWQATRVTESGFVLETSDGEYRAPRLIMAVGVAQAFTPEFPGRELTTHYVDTRPAESYAGKRLFIIGKQNSGFELASGLLSWASRIVLASPRPAKLSVPLHELLILWIIENPAEPLCNAAPVFGVRPQWIYTLTASSLFKARLQEVMREKGVRQVVVGLQEKLAGAAELVLGKARGIPAAIVRGVDVRGDGAAAELVMPRERDLFR